MYRVQTDSEVREQVAALPTEALLAYLEILGVLELVPWNGSSINPDNPDGSVRTVLFGGSGLLTYLILDPERRVDIVRVQWAG